MCKKTHFALYFIGRCFNVWVADVYWKTNASVGVIEPRAWCCSVLRCMRLGHMCIDLVCDCVLDGWVVWMGVGAGCCLLLCVRCRRFSSRPGARRSYLVFDVLTGLGTF
jgi:hypothetical protein